MTRGNFMHCSGIVTLHETHATCMNFLNPRIDSSYLNNSTSSLGLSRCHAQSQAVTHPRPLPLNLSPREIRGTNVPSVGISQVQRTSECTSTICKQRHVMATDYFKTVLLKSNVRELMIFRRATLNGLRGRLQQLSK